ncbi:MAG: hypothetical protein AAGA35_03225 [Patescibacteria group bacterium]
MNTQNTIILPAAGILAALLVSVWLFTPLTTVHAQTSSETSIEVQDPESQIALMLSLISVLQQLLELIQQRDALLAEDSTEEETKEEMSQEDEEEAEEEDEEEDESEEASSVTTSAQLITNSDADLTDDEGQFTVEFSLTAFGEDLYINRSSDRGTSLGTAGINFIIEDGAGDEDATGSAVAAISSDADREGSQFFIPEGDSASFTLTVVYDPATEGFYRMQLYSINFASDSVDPTDQIIARPEERYETDIISI